MEGSRRRLRLTDLARRITGFSTPLFGVQWTPPAAERDTVRGFLTFLEDRRVLFISHHLEVHGEVERSVHEIRHQCTETLTALPEQSRASPPIRAIRAACRRFLDAPRADFRNLYVRDFGDFRESAGFFTALGELRASVGAQVAVLAFLYRIELEAELASILPAEDDET
jgi:Family of unknown function (DUF6650)